jgi:hypothetical protein
MRAILPVAMLLILLGTVQAVAKDFAAGDFDAADPSQAENYVAAVESLQQELAITATGQNGAELFTVIPQTMELVVLQTQGEIHSSDAKTPEALAAIIADANGRKPRDNSFAFILDGDPEWVSQNVSIYYYTTGDNPEQKVIPVVRVDEPKDKEDGGMLAAWALMAEDQQQIRDFLLSPKVTMVVGEGDTAGSKIELNCGFWRSYSLFDQRQDASGSAAGGVPSAH